MKESLNIPRRHAVVVLMASARNPEGSGLQPNMWEELNRPRTTPQRDALTPSAASAEPVAGHQRVAANAEPVDTAQPEGAAPARSTAAQAMQRLDPQHLLLVGAASFVLVAFFAVRGLGSPGAESVNAATATGAAPTQLAAVDPTTTPSGDEPSPTIAPTPTTLTDPAAAPEATAMGLPAALLDSPQSQVYRLYQTALGREPDREGFAFWSERVRDGVPLEQLADEFLVSTEYQQQFASEADWNDRAEQLLTNAFGPINDEAELNTLLERFAGLDGSELLVAISESDETLAATGTLR